MSATQINEQDDDMLVELQGRIERITYTNEENGFTIARVKVPGRHDLVCVIGKRMMSRTKTPAAAPNAIRLIPCVQKIAMISTAPRLSTMARAVRKMIRLSGMCHEGKTRMRTAKAMSVAAGIPQPRPVGPSGFTM